MANGERCKKLEVDQSYWESVLGNYEEAVTSVFDCDREELILERIAKAGERNPLGCAADLGCGVGKFLPSLAEAFASVLACDWAATGIEAARDRCTGFSNTSFHRLDLARDRIPFEPVDFVLCVNVLIMPTLDERLRAWRAVTNQVKRGGSLLLVTPSHESALMEGYQELEARLDRGDNCAEAWGEGRSSEDTVEDLQLGVFSVRGARIKHYLQDELKLMLATHAFELSEMRRIVYPADPDKEVGASWDWLTVARRV